MEIITPKQLRKRWNVNQSELDDLDRRGLLVPREIGGELWYLIPEVEEYEQKYLGIEAKACDGLPTVFGDPTDTSVAIQE